LGFRVSEALALVLEVPMGPNSPHSVSFSLGTKGIAQNYVFLLFSLGTMGIAQT